MAGERECSSGRGVVKRCPTGLANPFCTAKVEKFQNGTESECMCKFCISLGGS